MVVWAEDGEFYGRGVEFPNVFNDGKTEAQCIANTRDALTTAVAVLLEDGSIPPSPVSGGTRTEQVNVRVAADEKLILEAAAQRQGFRGIGDFMRAAALEKVK